MPDRRLGETLVTRISDEVFVAVAPIVQINAGTLSALKDSMANAARGRVRLCMHRDESDPLHEMLIIIAKGSYVRPHRHPGKSESFHVLEGIIDVVLFDEQGRVEDVVALGPGDSDRNFYYRIAEPLYHMPVVRTDIAVVHEITNGPFCRDDTVFAPWAPREEDAELAAEFMRAQKQLLESR